MKHTALVLSSSLALSAAAAYAATPVNWPQFRGGSAGGVADGSTLPTQWSVKENVAWAAEIPGHGWSSPIIQDGRVYLTTSVPVPDRGDEDQSLRARSLDVATGEIPWNVEVFGPRWSSARAPVAAAPGEAVQRKERSPLSSVWLIEEPEDSRTRFFGHDAIADTMLSSDNGREVRGSRSWPRSPLTG